MKTTTIDQILTPIELVEALGLYRELKDTGRFAAAICSRLIEPNMTRIDASLGQENDAMYLAYCVEYVFGRVKDNG